MSLSDPLKTPDLDALRTFLASADPACRLAPLELRDLTISPDAHLRVAAAVEGALARRGHSGRRIVILKDTTPIARCGVDLCGRVRAQLEDGYSVTVETLRDGHAALHADEGVLAQAASAVRGADAVVTIGSGTITDIGKVACDRAGNVPLVVVQTAASVDGFTDDVSVVLANGVKRTIPSQWPDTVLADTTTIAGAPRAMNMAGFGEVLSLYTAPADWLLAGRVGLDETFHSAASDILKAAGNAPTDWAAGIQAGDAYALEALSSLLAIRGMVTGITGTTACLSGVEHVVSHMLDLHQSANGRPVGLHGAQVGVGAVLAATLWQSALNDGLVVTDRLGFPDEDAVDRRITAAFGHLGKDGRIARECRTDYRRKLGALSANWARITALVADWDRHAEELRELVSPPERITDALRAAGAPARYDHLEPAFSGGTVAWAVANAHLMRNRFTLIDLMDLLGVWEEDFISNLIGRAFGDSKPYESRARLMEAHT